MQPEEELVILPHFKPEEIEALRVEHERRKEVFLTPGLSGNDEERIRDAVQRENFWLAQPSSDHRDEELAHSYFQQGRVDEALALAKNPERRGWYKAIAGAILKDDTEACDCEHEDHIIGQFPSAKHNGAMVNMKQCPDCKQMNVTPL